LEAQSSSKTVRNSKKSNSDFGELFYRIGNGFALINRFSQEIDYRL
jgi:hypothetical protein